MSTRKLDTLIEEVARFAGMVKDPPREDRELSSYRLYVAQDTLALAAIDAYDDLVKLAGRSTTSRRFA